jgi:hypothetical protein
VNYLAFGAIGQLCQQPWWFISSVIGFWKDVQYGGAYKEKSQRWAEAGFDGWPSRTVLTPGGGLQNHCLVKCPSKDTRVFHVIWKPTGRLW